MKTFGISILLLGILALAIIGGCSKDKDVADLEREMMGESTATQAPDTTAPAPSRTMAPPDTAAGPNAGAIPKEPSRAQMPSRPTGSGYEVQIAGCEDQDYAQYLVDLYRKRGYEPYVTTATIEGQKYYRVRLGVFQTLSEAKRVQAELADRYSASSWIDQG